MGRESQRPWGAGREPTQPAFPGVQQREDRRSSGSDPRGRPCRGPAFLLGGLVHTTRTLLCGYFPPGWLWPNPPWVWPLEQVPSRCQPSPSPLRGEVAGCLELGLMMAG